MVVSGYRTYDFQQGLFDRSAARNGLGRAADAVCHHGAHHIQHLGRRLAAAHAALHGGIQALRDAFAVFIHNGLCEGGRDIGAICTGVAVKAPWPKLKLASSPLSCKSWALGKAPDAVVSVPPTTLAAPKPARWAAIRMASPPSRWPSATK